MRSRARAVVIGGGVGGASILYWLARLGWDDVVLCRARGPDQRLDLPFRRPGRAAARLDQPDEDDDELGRPLPDARGGGRARDRLARGRLASARLVGGADAGASPPGRLGEDLRAPARARLRRAGAELFPPMSTDGVLGAAYLPTDGYIDPSQLTFALAEGARRRGAEINTNTRVTGIGLERGRVVGVETDKGSIETGDRRQRGRHVRGRDRAPRGRDRADHPDGPRVPHHAAERDPARHPDDARPVAPRLLPRRVGRPRHGRLRAEPARRGGSTASRRTSTASCSPEDWERFDELMTNAVVRVPDARGRRGHQPRQRARRRSRPTASSSSGRVRRARLLGRGRLLRARARRRGRDGPARRRVDRRGSPEPRRLGDGLAPLRPALPEPRLHARAHVRDLLDLLRHQVPGPGAARRAAAQALADLRAAPGARRVFGEKSGWERANWFEPNAASGDESLRPRGWAGKIWSPAIGAEHRACRETAALFDETSFAKIDVVGPGAAELPRAHLRQPRRPRRRRDHVHADAEPARRDRVRLHRHAARRGPLPDRHRDGVRQPRRRLDPPAPPGGRSASGRGRDVAPACLGLWGPAAREILAAAHRRDLSNDASATCARRRSRSGRCPASPFGSPMSASSAGSSTARWSSGSASGTRSGRRHGARPRRRRLQGDRLAPAREGLPRLGRGHHARRDARTRPASTSPSSSTRGTSSAATRSARRGRAGAAARLPRPLRPTLGRARLGAGARRRRDCRPRHERRLRLHRRALDRLRVPAGGARRAGHAVEVEIFGDWIGWHALLTIMACAAGKDIYVEKPMTVFIDEGKWIIQAARKHQRIVVVGTQRRHGKGVAEAKKVVESGQLGRSTRSASPRCAIFTPALARLRSPTRLPPSITTCGRGPRPRALHRASRALPLPVVLGLFWRADDQSGSAHAGPGAHVMNVKGPSMVTSTGGRFALEDDGETPDLQDAMWVFPGFTVNYCIREANAMRGIRRAAVSCIWGPRAAWC